MSGLSIRIYIKPRPEATLFRLDPAIAELWLANNPRNRRIRPWYAKALADAMIRGEWRVTSQGIGIDTNGNLIDGQHRCEAVRMSGVAIETVVVMGLPPAAFEATDIGIKRTTADLMALDRGVSEVLRLAGEMVYGSRPTVDQLWPLYRAGLGEALTLLTEHCNTTARFFSSAGMRLAAAVRLMNGEPSTYILAQYRAMVAKDYAAMSAASQALTRQVEQGVNVTAGGVAKRFMQPREALARGLIVFDLKKRAVSRIQLNDQVALIAFARDVLQRSVAKDLPVTGGVR